MSCQLENMRRYNCGELTIFVNAFNGRSSRQAFDSPITVISSMQSGEIEKVLIVCFAVSLN